MDLPVLIGLFLLGLCVGSFCNVLIYRIPKGEEFVKTSSHCMTCGHKLSWYENIHLVSWLIQGGKCRGCGECVASCPQHTIGLTVKNGKKIARIRHADCIRCYCCQELCPFEAIRIKKNFVIRLADSL